MGAPEGAQPSTKLASVPERLDHVTIQLDRAPIVISWEECTALRTWMGIHERAGEATKRKFFTVTATSPIQLTPDEKEWLLNFIDTRTQDDAVLDIEMTAGIAALRNALAAEQLD